MKTKPSVILRHDEIQELLRLVRLVARVYGLLGHYEDKEAVYAFIEQIETRIDGKPPRNPKKG